MFSRPEINQPMKVATCVVALAIFTVALTATRARATTQPEKLLHQLINNARVSRGLPRLRLSDGLSNVARAHSAEMAKGGRVLYHSCLPCRLRSWDWRMAGENVGTDMSVYRIHSLFMQSVSHRSKLLRPGFRRAGIGVVQAGERLWVTQVFLG